MVKAKTSDAPAVDPEGVYRVALLRSVTLKNGQTIRPKDDLTVKGKVIADLGDAVKSFEQV